MKNIYFCFALLILLPYPLASANQGDDDSLTPLYNAITDHSLPGISAFIDVLVENDSEDFSDYWFISRAQCAYLCWVVQRNQQISNNQDVFNEVPLSSEARDSQESIITEYCHDRLWINSLRLPDISTLKLPSPKPPYFPVEDFIAAEETSFSHIGSFVQQMPSYQALDIIGQTSSNTLRKRIILETILFLLGRVAHDEPADPWSEQYTSSFRAVMRPFQCSRFIKPESRDLTGFSDCLEQQSDSDVQRSNHAITLTDIALGDFLPGGYSPDFFDSYGYPPGFAVAGHYSGKPQPDRYMTSGLSVIAETMVLASLIRHVSRY